VKKTPSIDIIFEKDKSGKLTLNALLRQDILRYFPDVLKKTENSEFTFSDLVVWLLKHNEEFFNYYQNPSTRNIPIRNRISHRWDRVKKRFEELTSLELISEVGNKKTRTGIITSVYVFTDFGQVVSLVVYLAGLEAGPNKNNIIEDTYNLLRSIYLKNKSSLDRYSLSIFEQLWKKRLFVLYLESISLTLGSDATIFDKLNPIPRVHDEDFIQIKKEALKQLAGNEKKAFLNSFKTVVEAKFCNSSLNFRGFEEVLSRCTGNAEELAVEGFCQNCKLYFPLVITTIDYFCLPSHADHMLITCQRCKVPYSMSIRKYHGRDNPLLTDFL